MDLDGDGWQEYVPPHGTEAPYVYFDGRVIPVGTTSIYGYMLAQYPKTTGTLMLPLDQVGVARPYRSTTPIDNRDNKKTMPNTAPNVTKWIKPGQFQIICAGQDNHFGVDDMSGTSVVFKQFPVPNYYQSATLDRSNDEDNLFDFSEGKTMEGAIP